MPNPSQQRALPGKPFRYVTAGVALVGASTIALTPATAPTADVHVRDIQLTSTDITIEIVRHADTNPPDATDLIAGNGLPGAPLSGLPSTPFDVPTAGTDGWAQATDTANTLFGELGNQIDGIFGGYEQRMIETALPMLSLLGDSYQELTPPTQAFVPGELFNPTYFSSDYQPLEGFDEIGGGIYADSAPSTPGAYLSEIEGFLWFLGVEFAPLLGSNDWNGIQFDQNFSSAIDTVYTDTSTDAANSFTGEPTDLVYSGEGAITGWTSLNVLNPDLGILLPDVINAISSGEFLPPAGYVEITGNPTDGWTLVNFDGQAIPSDPGLVTDLFVDTRSLIIAPQTAAWNIFESVFGGAGDPPGTALPSFTEIWDTFWTNIGNVGTAIIQYPVSVFTDTYDELQNIITEVAGGESIGDALGQSILGLLP